MAAALLPEELSEFLEQARKQCLRVMTINKIHGVPSPPGERSDRIPGFRRGEFRQLVGTAARETSPERTAADILNILSVDYPANQAIPDRALIGINKVNVRNWLTTQRNTPAWRDAYRLMAQLFDYKPTVTSNVKQSDPATGLGPSISPPFHDASTASQPPTMGHNRPPAASRLWREVTRHDFDRPAGAETDSIPQEFLRGEDQGPWWPIQHVAISRDALDTLADNAEMAPVVLVKGPIGEGKTVLIRQLAAMWLGKNRRVYELKSHEALQDKTFIDQLIWEEQPLLILDQPGLAGKLPPWLAWTGVRGGTLIIGLQTRLASSQSRLITGLRVRELLVPRPDPDREAKRFAQAIVTWNAGQATDVEQVLEKFIDGLNLRGGGGLWCAQWQATRGIKLQARIEALITEFALEPDKFDALAAVTFVNGLREFSNYRLDNLRRSVLERLITRLDLKKEAMAARIARLGEMGALLEGEFLRSGIDDQRNPQMELRHPVITHALFKLIFGSRLVSGDRVVSKWPFYGALGEAYTEMGDREAAVVVLQQHGEAWMKSRPYLHFHADMRNHSRLDTARAIAAGLGDIIDTSDTNLLLAKAALDGNLNHEAIATADHQFGETRVAAVLADINATAPQLVEAARLAQKHNIADLDWRHFASLGYKSLTGPDKYRLASKILGIYCEDARTTPIETQTWAARAAIDRGYNAREGLHISLRHLAERFKTLANVYPDYYNGPPERELLGSIRSIYRTFWKIASRTNQMSKGIERMLRAPRRPMAVQTELKPLIESWYEFDRETPSNWPDGVIEELGLIREYPDKWLAFLKSYDEYFPPKVVQITPPPS